MPPALRRHALLLAGLLARRRSAAAAARTDEILILGNPAGTADRHFAGGGGRERGVLLQRSRTR